MHCCKAASVWYRRRDRMHSCCAITAVSRDFASISAYYRQQAMNVTRGDWLQFLTIAVVLISRIGQLCRTQIWQIPGGGIVMCLMYLTKNKCSSWPTSTVLAYELTYIHACLNNRYRHILTHS
jgi:hypothetical protein